jgi:hypothetical protein
MRRFLPLILCILLLAPAALAADGPDGWLYYKDLSTGGSEQYKYFFLDHDVYRLARPDLADLRLTDAGGEAVPYYLQKGYDITQAADISYSTRQTDYFKKMHDTYIDFQVIPLHADTDITANKLAFSLPPGDLLKQVEVAGSYDGLVWEAVTAGQVWRVSGLEKNHLLLPAVKKYGYYRIRIPDDLDDTRLGLQAVLSHRETWQTPYRRHTTPVYEIKQENRETHIVIQNHDHLRISVISLTVDGNFQRTYRVLAGGSPVLDAGRGEFYNLRFRDFQVSNTAVTFVRNPLSARTITLVIEDKDNPPLDVRGVVLEYLVDKLVFEDKGRGPYSLHFGNPAAQAPSYEIELFKKHVEREIQGQLVPGALVRYAVPEPEPVPEQRDWRLVFNIVIGLVSLLLVVFLARKVSLPDER